LCIRHTFPTRRSSDLFGEDIKEFVSSHYPVDDGKLKELLTEYITKFVVPYPTFGPLEEELLQHCLSVGKSIDDLPTDKQCCKSSDRKSTRLNSSHVSI